MKYSFPTYFNLKCIILTISSFIIYILQCILYDMYDKTIRIPIILSIVTTIASIVSIMWYHGAYRCKRNSIIGKIIFVVISSSISFIAYGMSILTNKTDKENFRKYQVINLTRLLYIPIIIGIFLYVLMDRYDNYYKCQFKLKPTAISFPTAFLKSPNYRKQIYKNSYHIIRFSIWSSVIYISFLIGTLPFAVAINFQTKKYT